MASAHVTSARVAPSANGTTSSSVDSTGGNFVFVYVNSYSAAGAPTLSDSKSNIYTAMTARVGGNIRIQGFYCQSATCGTGHTWTLSGSGTYCTAYAIVRSGMATSGGFDQENNGTSVGTTIRPGSITPTEAGTTAFVGVSGNASLPTSITDSYTIQHEDAGSGSGFAGGLAYKYLTGTSAINPTWTTNDGGGSSVAFTANFKEDAGGGGGATNGSAFGSGRALNGGRTFFGAMR